jgi:hypothetical protein
MRRRAHIFSDVRAPQSRCLQSFNDFADDGWVEISSFKVSDDVIAIHGVKNSDCFQSRLSRSYSRRVRFEAGERGVTP